MVYNYKGYNNYKYNYKYSGDNRHKYKPGGYKGLALFIQTQIIQDFTVEFCRRYIRPIDNSYNGYKSYRTAEQMEQAARSGKQNISEGYGQREFRGKLTLMKVARGSLEELLQDYLDFVRQKGLALWEKEDARAKKVRGLVYKIRECYGGNGYNNYKNYNTCKNYNTDNSYKNYNSYNDYNNYKKAYGLYRPYLDFPEGAANAMVCLINQTNMMLNKKLDWLDENAAKEDVMSPHDRWLQRQMDKEWQKNKNFDRQLVEDMRQRGYIFTNEGYKLAEEAKRRGLEEIEIP